MTLDVLICTCNEGICNVPSVLLPLQEGVQYIVSYQISEERYKSLIPSILKERKDVVLSILNGLGLSKNRNNALALAKSDICLIADDDVHYQPDSFQIICKAFEENSQAKMLLFRAEDYEGKPIKHYPSDTFEYARRPRGYSPSSIEITFRRTAVQGHFAFDERFGLGSDCFGCGEEEIFVHTAYLQGLNPIFIPKTIVATNRNTTGTHIYENAQLQAAKGAVIFFIYGHSSTLRCLKFALLSYLHGKSPFWSLWRNMKRGITIMKNGEGQHG